MEETNQNNSIPKTIFDDVNKEQHYFSIFESYSYFPKPSNYVMEQINIYSKNSNDIIEKKIVKSTLEGLVIHLTNPIDSVDYNNMHDFFIVYRDFMNSERLLEIILYRLKWSISKLLPINMNDLKDDNTFNINNIPTLNSSSNLSMSNDEELIKLYAIIVIRVFVMVRHWITNYFIEDFFYNDTLFYSFVTFFDKDLVENLSPLVFDNQEYKNLKIVLNCIVTLKKQWVHKLNECFIDPYYENTPDSKNNNNSTNEWFKYNLSIYQNHPETKLHNSKRMSIFALKNSIDPIARNKSFLNIIGTQSIQLPNSQENKSSMVPSLQNNNGARSTSKSKQSILFPKNFNYMTIQKEEEPSRIISEDSNTITPNYRNFSGVSSSKNASVISDSNQHMSIIDIPKNNRRMISLSTNNDSLRDSETSSGKLDFIQVLNVPETSTIDMILPSTPAKKLEFTISLDDLIEDQNNFINSKEQLDGTENTKTAGSDLSVRQSIYGLLNKWGTTSENIHKPTEADIEEVVSVISVEQENPTEEQEVKAPPAVVPQNNDTKEVNKFVRYVFSIAAINPNNNNNNNNNKNNNMNNEREEEELKNLKNKEYVKNLIKEGEHRFDILSARSIDEVQYLINRESDQLQDAVVESSKSVDENGDEVELSQMDNLNLYNTVVKMANTVLSSNHKNNIKSKSISQLSINETTQTTPLNVDTNITTSQTLTYESPEKDSNNYLNFATSPFLRSIEKTKSDFANRDWMKKSPSIKKKQATDFNESIGSDIHREEPLTPTPAKHMSKPLDNNNNNGNGISNNVGGLSDSSSSELKLKLPDSKGTILASISSDEEKQENITEASEANETILELPSSTSKATPSRSVSENSHLRKEHMRTSSIQSYQSMYSYIKQDLPKARNSGRISISSGNHNNRLSGKTKRYGSLKLAGFSGDEHDINSSDDNNSDYNHIRNKNVSRTPSLMTSPSFIDKDELFQQQEDELRQLSAKMSSSSLRKSSLITNSKSQRNSGNNLKNSGVINEIRDTTPFETPLINSNSHIKMSPTFTNISNLITNPKEPLKRSIVSADERESGSAVSSVNTELLFHDAISSLDNTITQKNSDVSNGNQEPSSSMPRRWTAGLDLHLSDLEPLAEQDSDDQKVTEIEEFYESSDRDEEINKPELASKPNDLRKLFQQQFQSHDEDSNVPDNRLSYMIYGDDASNEEIYEAEIFEKKHNLEAAPKEIAKYDDNEQPYLSEEEEEAVGGGEILNEDDGDDADFQGENPLELAMRKLEGTFDEITYGDDGEKEEENNENIDNIDEKENQVPEEELSFGEKEESNDQCSPLKNSSNGITKSKSVNNIFFHNKRSSILVQNRRKTLLSTTNLSEDQQKNLFINYKVESSSPEKTGDLQGNEMSTGMYINDLLSDYTIRDDTLLISNYKEHIPFILMYGSRDIAQQMTLIERDVLNEVDWKSLLQLQMNENLKTYTSWLEVLVNQDELSGIDLGVARFNLTVDWIISEIVLTRDIKLKRNVLQKYIHVAEHCIRLQNFNTSMQIVLALSSIEVQYFKESWRLVEPGDMLSWAEMKNLFSSEYDDYKGLRELMNDMEPIRGCLPFLVLYLSDLKNLANKSTFFHSNHDIVNYQKFHTLASIVKNFIQRVNWGIEFYKLESNPQLLSKCLYISSLKEYEIAQIINEGYD